MNSTSVNSSKTSKKEVENVFNFKISGGFFIQDGKELKMDKRHTIDNSLPMFEVAAKNVGTYEIKEDSKGNKVRIDTKTGAKYVTGKDGKTKRVKAQKEQSLDR